MKLDYSSCLMSCWSIHVSYQGIPDISQFKGCYMSSHGGPQVNFSVQYEKSKTIMTLVNYRNFAWASQGPTGISLGLAGLFETG